MVDHKNLVHETTNGALVGSETQRPERELIILQGITTSQVQRALRADNPYPARVFLKPDDHHCPDFDFETGKPLNSNCITCDIPIFFRIKDPIKSKFHDDLTTGAIKTYELEINHCPFCQKELVKKIGIGYCFSSQCPKLFEKSGGWIKPKIKTGSLIEVKGYFDNPKNGSNRKSFTAYSYQILEKEPNYYLEGKKCLSCQKPAQKAYFADATKEPQHFFCAEIVCFEKWAKIHQPSQIFESHVE